MDFVLHHFELALLLFLYPSFRLIWLVFHFCLLTINSDVINDSFPNFGLSPIIFSSFDINPLLQCHLSCDRVVRIHFFHILAAFLFCSLLLINLCIQLDLSRRFLLMSCCDGIGIEIDVPVRRCCNFCFYDKDILFPE